LSHSKKKPSQERAGGVAQGEGPEFKPQDRKKKSHWSVDITIKKMHLSPSMMNSVEWLCISSSY
jgi:hypothetical protein